MTPTTLKTYTCKALAQMAKKEGVQGWHSMRKDELVRALARATQKRLKKRIKGDSPKARGNSASPNGTQKGVRSRSQSKPRANPQHSLLNGTKTNGTSSKPGNKPKTAIQKRIAKLQERLEQQKNIGTTTAREEISCDRLVVMVRDPYWLHACWELTQQSIDRARVALAQAWHTAKPVLRLYAVVEAGSDSVLKDIEIHGGVTNWYVDVQKPPSSFRLEIGYLTPSGVFYCLARSNTVTTPPAGTSDAIDENWVDVAENADRIFAMSGGYSPHGTSKELQELMEERLRRPMGSPMQTRFGSGALVGEKNNGLPFAVDAELIVYGVSHRHAHVTLRGEPVTLRDDGSFAVRISLPDKKQVIPVVACSPDGVEERTIMLAVERNTKSMEPITRDIGQ